MFDGEAAEEKKDKKEEGEAEVVWEEDAGQGGKSQGNNQGLNTSAQATGFCLETNLSTDAMVIWSHYVILIKPFDDHYSHDCIIWQWSR